MSARISGSLVILRCRWRHPQLLLIHQFCFCDVRHSLRIFLELQFWECSQGCRRSRAQLHKSVSIRITSKSCVLRTPYLGDRLSSRFLRKIAFEECDTGYATDRGVECYEIPLSTGVLRPWRRRRSIRFRSSRWATVARNPATVRSSNGISRCRHLLDSRRHSAAAHRQEGRRVRQAQRQENRAGLSRLALRQRADRAHAKARANAWL